MHNKELVIAVNNPGNDYETNDTENNKTDSEKRNLETFIVAMSQGIDKESNQVINHN